MLLKRGNPAGDVGTIVEKFRETARRHRIRCPSCAWEPESSARWHCVPTGAPEYFAGGCRTAWNTFDTRGVCPGCSHQWQWTACLQCGAWALHKDWYVPEDDPKAP